MTREEQLQTVYENVAASCRIAQSAVEQEQSRAKEDGREIKEIYIAGDIGPVPEKPRGRREGCGAVSKNIKLWQSTSGRRGETDLV